MPPQSPVCARGAGRSVPEHAAERVVLSCADAAAVRHDSHAVRACQPAAAGGPPSGVTTSQHRPDLSTFKKRQKLLSQRFLAGATAERGCTLQACLSGHTATRLSRAQPPRSPARGALQAMRGARLAGVQRPHAPLVGRVVGEAENGHDHAAEDDRRRERAERQPQASLPPRQCTAGWRGHVTRGHLPGRPPQALQECRDSLLGQRALDSTWHW